MAIRFKCANCGNPIVADDSAAGKRTSCPVCGIMVFLPRLQAPAEEKDGLGLADDDPAAARKMAEQLEAENRAFNKMMMSSDDKLPKAEPGGPAAELDEFQIENLIVDWMTGTVEGNVELAETSARQLRGRTQQVVPVLNGLDVALLVDSPLTDMPPPVLKKLKAQLLAEVGKPPAKP